MSLQNPPPVSGIREPRIDVACPAGYLQGTVKWFNNDKGYGFAVSVQGRDVFIHYRDIQGLGYRTLIDGEVIYYKAQSSDKRLRAIHVIKASATARTTPKHAEKLF